MYLKQRDIMPSSTKYKNWMAFQKDAIMKNTSWNGLKFGIILVFILSLAPVFANAEDLTVYARRDTSVQSKTGIVWAVSLQFNAPVFPSNLAQSTRVGSDGVEEKFELRIPGQSEKAKSPAREFVLVPLKASDKPSSVKITIKKGLSDSAGRILLIDNFTHEFISMEMISVTGISTFCRSQTNKGLMLELSDDTTEDELRKAVSITPTVRGLTVAREQGLQYRITGEFEYDKDYLLRISSERVDAGRAILESQDFPFKGPGLKSEILIRSDRSIVELIGRQLLPLTLSNVSAVRCKLERVLPFFLAETAEGLRSNDKRELIDLKGKTNNLSKISGTKRINPVFLGEVSQDSDVFFAPEAKAHIYGYSLPLSFRKAPDSGGAWIASLDDPNGQSQGEATKLIQITDLSLSYKISAQTLLFWATSLYTGLPVSGADLMLVRNDGQKFFVGQTDQDGILIVKSGQAFPSVQPGAAEIVTGSRPLDVSTIKWAVAATKKDSCGLELDTFRLKPFGVTQAEQVKDPTGSQTGCVFTERGVYQPGETVHFKFVSREYKEGEVVSPTGEQVKIEVIGPRNDVHYSNNFKLGEFGTCYGSFDVKKFFPVGTYTLNVLVGKSSEAGNTYTCSFMAQEFKRPRHFVSVSIKQEDRVSESFVGVKFNEEFLSVDIKGRYYSGGPLKHGRLRWKATLVPAVNTVHGLEGYFFGNQDDSTRFLESGESVLDRDGNLRVAVPLDNRLLTGIYGVRISVTVLDIDGEPTSEVETFNPRPKFLVGISDHPRQVQAGYASPLRVIVIDRDGNKVSSGKIEAAIMQKRYFFTQKRDEAGNINDLWEEGWMKSITSQQSIVNGQAGFPLELNDEGDYLISVTYDDAGGRYSSQTLFAVGWKEYDQWLRSKAETGVRTSNEILLATNRKDYGSGDSVKVEFRTPRPARKCLATLERGEILDHQVIDLSNGEGVYQFTAREKFHPNVYVSVMAPAGRSGFPIYASQPDLDIPTVYYGYLDVSVRNRSQKLKLDIEPGVRELKGRPGDKKAVALKVTDQRGTGVVCELAVCVVDEAVLALTKYTTPDLSSLLRFNLALSVFSGDLRLDLVSQDLFRAFLSRPLTGGGDGSGDVVASLRKDFRPVAFFNPAVMTDRSGQATVEFVLPDSTTTYRIYAVACDKGSGIASADRNLLVTKEFFIEPSLPRFFVAGDHATFPITLKNSTGVRGKVNLEASSSKNVAVERLESNVTLEPHSSEAAQASVLVAGGSDKGSLRFQGTFSGDSTRYLDAIELSFPVYSRFLPVRRAMIGDFVRETDILVNLPDAVRHHNPNEVNPADYKAYLTLAATDWARIEPGLKYLLTYPYGCVEQTSSGIIPLAGIGSLIKSGTFPGISEGEVNRFLLSGLDRLLSMQLATGGFPYWPGQLNPSLWGTVYAAFALTEARSAGYDVPEDRWEKALQFIKENLFRKDKDVHQDAVWTREWAVFNLAAGGMLTTHELATFFENYDSIGPQAKALLILSAKRVGYLPDSKLAELVGKLQPRYDLSRTNYNDSTFRELAICLMAAVETGSALDKADTWAGTLLRGLRPEGRWVSTADTGWCLLALSRYYKGKEPPKTGNITYRINYGGEKLSEVTSSESTAYVEIDARKLLEGKKMRLEADTTRLVNYVLHITYPESTSDSSHLSRGFSLRKTMENLNGKKEINVGDVIRVTLDMTLLDTNKKDRDGSFEYLVLEDAVPAGMVPINSDLKTEGLERGDVAESNGSRAGSANDFTPTYAEFRDDGVRVFKNSALQGNYQYSYLARAVAEGEFWMRGSKISLMYNPELYAVEHGQVIKIFPVSK